MDIGFLMSALVVNVPLAFSPGPTNILCLSVASSKGFKGSLNFIAGLQVLPLIYSLVVAFSAGAILAKFTFVSIAMKIVGSLYMLYLAISMFRSISDININKKIKANFIYGVFAQSVNPKNITIIITIYSLFSTQASNYRYGIALAFIITLCNLSSHLVWGYSAKMIIGENTFISKYQNKFFGIMLLLAILTLWL